MTEADKGTILNPAAIVSESHRPANCSCFYFFKSARNCTQSSLCFFCLTKNNRNHSDCKIYLIIIICKKKFTVTRRSAIGRAADCKGY